MKERIVIDFKGNKARNEVVKLLEFARNDNFDCIVYKQTEQVPESWEELKALCREKEIYFESDVCLNRVKCITINQITFYDDGEIQDDYRGFVYATNRTPAQMWQIIKALVVD